MVLDNIYRGRAHGIALGTIALVILLLSVNYLGIDRMTFLKRQ
jgi:hypothetical protein